MNSYLIAFISHFEDKSIQILILSCLIYNSINMVKTYEC